MPKPATENPEPKQVRPTVEDYRVEQFEYMGFTHAEAGKLAVAQDKNKILVRPSKVQEALERGCHPRLALRIFT